MQVRDRERGSQIADYRIEAVLGRGGMSVVYLAEDLRLKRRVALKLLTPALAADERFRDRFLRESELAASLDHANVIPIYEAGEADGSLFIAMRYVEGSDLKALLRDGPLSQERAVLLAGQVAAALDAAHERGLVHGDVKPSNVLIDGRGHAYLADFGLTKRVTDERPAAGGEAQLMGTIDYVSPEQIRGEDVDGRADVYSLGCLLYECLTGRQPFKRGNDAAILYAHLEDEPPQPARRRTRYSRGRSQSRPTIATRPAATSPRRHGRHSESPHPRRSRLPPGDRHPSRRQPASPPSSASTSSAAADRTARRSPADWFELMQGRVGRWTRSESGEIRSASPLPAATSGSRPLRAPTCGASTPEHSPQVHLPRPGRRQGSPSMAV